MAGDHKHPDREALHEYIRGGLSEGEAAELREHVLSCEECAGALQREARLFAAVAEAEDAPAARKRVRPWMWAPVGIAALVAIGLVLPPRSVELPPYSIAMSGGVAESRGAEGNPPPRLARFTDGTTLTITMRPETSVGAGVESVAHLRGDEQPFPLTARIDEETGAVRLIGQFGATLPEPAPGEQTLLVGVGSGGAAPTADELEEAVGSGSTVRGWQAFRLSFRYGEDDGGTGLGYFGCDEVWEGPVCGLKEVKEIGFWLDGGEDTEAEVTVPGGAGPVAFVPLPELGGLRATVEVRPDVDRVVVTGRLRGTEFEWTMGVKAVETPNELLRAQELEAAGRRDDSLALLEELAAGPAPELRARAAGSLASGAWRRAAWDEATELLGRSADAYEAAGAPGPALVGRAQRAYLELEYAESIDEVLDGLEPTKSSAGDLEAAYLLAFFRGSVGIRTGDHREALRQLARAGAIAGRLDRGGWSRDAEELLAEAYNAAGLQDRALEFASTTLRSAPADDPCKRARTWNNLAWRLLLARESGSIPDAATLAALPVADPKVALERATAVIGADCIDGDGTRSNIEINLALASLQEGDPKAAAKHLAASKSILADPEVTQQLWRHYLEGRIALRRGRPDLAGAAFGALEELSRAARSTEFRWRGVLGRARALALGGSIDDALRVYSAARALTLEHSLDVPRHLGRAAFLAETARAGMEEVALLLASGRTEEALETAREWRASYLSTERRPDHLAAMSDERKQEYAGLVAAFRSVRAAEARLAAAEWRTPEDQLAALDAERKALSRAAPGLLDGALTGSEGRSEAFRAPDQDELLLFFLDDGQEIVAFARDSRETVGRRIGSIDASAAAAALSEQLLAPFAAAIGRAETITVLATGRLRGVDFHRLPIGGAPLLEAVAVRYSLDLPARQATRPRPRRSLLVSDPTGDLPGARREGAHAMSRLGETGLETMTLQGESATRSAVLSALEDVDVMHLAGHASYDPRSGTASIRLAGSTELSVGDVLSLESAPRLGLLSACEGARTDEAAVETLGLAQAFVMAGADALIGSVRPVDDELAATFAEELYEAGWPGSAPAEAFRRAGVGTAERAPGADWAAFRLIVR